MKTEFECRFIDINIPDMKKRLAAAGFKCIEPEHLMRRKIFFLPEKDGMLRWLRLRDEGNQTTLTLKARSKDTSSYLKEIECPIGDFETMAELIEASDLKCEAVQENKREKWAKDNVEICFDTWPGLDTYMEIEADGEEAVKRTVVMLGLNMADAMFGNVAEVYLKKLGIPMTVHNFGTFENPIGKWEGD